MNKKGFTFIEVAIAIAILGIISVISLPSFFSWLPRYRLQTSVRQIYDDMNMAKSRAVRANSVAVAIFSIPNDTYTIFLDTSSPLNWALDGGETVISTGNLQNGVDIINTTFNAHTYGFNNRGMTQTGAIPGDVHLTNSSGLFMGVRVNVAGGLSIINSPDGGMTWQ